MKYRYFITIFTVFYFSIANALDFNTFSKLDDNKANLTTKYAGLSAQKLSELTTFIDKAIKNPEKKPAFIGEDSTSSHDCSQCPKHLKLTGQINKILEEMKKDPKLSLDEVVPVNINRLKFLYYTVKTREEDGTFKCTRFHDYTPNLRPTNLDGQMNLVAENVFKFDFSSSVQILDPKKEEIIYYYRGEGDQKNIIVQAILGKNGGKFRYYYYLPTEIEKNPYGLPSMNEKSLGPTKSTATLDAKTIRPEVMMNPENKIDSKNKFSLSLDPKLETEMKIIPKNIHVADAEVSQNFGGEDGVRVKAKSHLSLKGNEASMDLQNENETSFVQVDVLTSLNGKTTKTITVPYEMKLGVEDDIDAMRINGKIQDSKTQQFVTMSLADSSTTYMRSEFKINKLTNMKSYIFAKDFSIDKEQMATVAVGSNEEKKKYVSLQHRKAIKDNVTMVLDVRIDENKRTTFFYQLKARF